MLVDKQSGEIFLYQPIGGGFFEEGITAEGVILALDSLGGKRAKIRINSPGGSVDEGVAIYNALKRYSGGVDTVVDSLAASIASVIALAGENRTTAKGSRWMIHRAMMLWMGNTEEFTQAAEVLAKHDKSLVEIYSEVLPGKSSEDILAMMSAETWFTSQEAVEAGLSTAIDGEEALKPNIANWFRNAPAAVYKEAIEGVNKTPVLRNAALIRSRM